VPQALDLVSWLRERCGSYAFDVGGIFNRPGAGAWPIQAESVADLERQLIEREHLLPLPKESAALANVLEVLVVDFLLEAAAEVPGLEWQRGTERGYPDIEMHGPALGDRFWAVDVKVARRKPLRRGGVSRNTNSRITLYTGNTYFKHPDLHWPGTFRPFSDYAGHVDILLLYTLNLEARGRAEELELIVQEPWTIGSKERSSTTREYIGAVTEIDRLREGRGDFQSADEFYRYWRNFPFRLSPGIERTLTRLVAEQRAELDALRAAQQKDNPPTT
jgi:Restriction endonuclease EcoRV